MNILVLKKNVLKELITFKSHLRKKQYSDRYWALSCTSLNFSTGFWFSHSFHNCFFTKFLVAIMKMYQGINDSNHIPRLGGINHDLIRNRHSISERHKTTNSGSGSTFKSSWPLDWRWSHKLYLCAFPLLQCGRFS